MNSKVIIVFLGIFLLISIGLNAYFFTIIGDNNEEIVTLNKLVNDLQDQGVPVDEEKQVSDSLGFPVLDTPNLLSMKSTTRSEIENEYDVKFNSYDENTGAVCDDDRRVFTLQTGPNEDQGSTIIKDGYKVQFISSECVDAMRFVTVSIPFPENELCNSLVLRNNIEEILKNTNNSNLIDKVEFNNASSRFEYIVELDPTNPLFNITDEYKIWCNTDSSLLMTYQHVLIYKNQ